MNLNMLKFSIQGLELQRAALQAMKDVSDQMKDVATPKEEPKPEP
jgi:hypothetical protein